MLYQRMDHHWVQQKQQVGAPLKVQKTMEKQANFGKFEKLSKIQSKEFEAYFWHISKVQHNYRRNACLSFKKTKQKKKKEKEKRLIVQLGLIKSILLLTSPHLDEISWSHPLPCYSPLPSCPCLSLCPSL